MSLIHDIAHRSAHPYGHRPYTPRWLKFRRTTVSVGRDCSFEEVRQAGLRYIVPNRESSYIELDALLFSEYV